MALGVLGGFRGLGSCGDFKCFKGGLGSFRALETSGFGKVESRGVWGS